MALFAALVIAGVILCRKEFLDLAATNIWLNGIIIGTTIFGIGLCFADIFKLIPEYKWMRNYFAGKTRAADLPPKILRPVAIMLQKQKSQRANYISTGAMNNFLEVILGRFEDSRESVRYITNTLIFLGLLGTFWGLIHTVGGFADLVGGLDFGDENIMAAVQSGLAKPLGGMGIAFTCSLLGLAGSLIVGFLGLQVQLAQNALFRELEENLSSRAQLFGYLEPGSRGEETALPYVNAAAKELTKAVEKLEKTVSKLT
jgi:hypothetical protein